ncbi:hypothetical protein Mp_4g01800 [Marchantia polymorpha subsp. ruderalis]|uniref:Uncharacterized protein n=2 Tax=Marchantia polymorpha TaxID=3197 RepID=A0AAF6B5A7_MARPO|nr:hypothetical protein MARPO_0098s0020 [Marchantia polymorpha]BBN07191.1 hypothetical protein Mp_4g01800 [Marchantia polymorpha subsp. ruderalis]|eukprot:PTQ32468.1 hypothetical protein MARPO_0098s0020 [Marchantia polymorpha]
MSVRDFHVLLSLFCRTISYGLQIRPGSAWTRGPAAAAAAESTSETFEGTTMYDQALDCGWLRMDGPKEGKAASKALTQIRAQASLAS